MDSSISQDQHVVGKRAVTKADLLNFYNSIKSADTIGIYDAAEALGNGDVAGAREMLATARTQYERRHRRSLAHASEQASGKQKPSSREIEKATARKEKIERALSTFDAYLAVLDRTVKIQKAVPHAPRDDFDPRLVALGRTRKSSTGSDETEPPRLSEPFLDQLRSATDAAAEYQVICSVFESTPASSERDLRSHGLYALRAQQHWHLLRITSGASLTDTIPFTSATKNRPVNPISKEAFLRAGRDGRAFLLTPRAVQQGEDSVVFPSGLRGPKVAKREDVVLDENEFNVLWGVVRDTGLLSNAADITLVKKNEFRKKQFGRALKQMRILERSFSAATRVQRQAFARELQELEARKQELPLREVEKRKIRIAQETRKIERAEIHFLKVMNGLHALEARDRPSRSAAQNSIETNTTPPQDNPPDRGR